jgi:hypothetical protein
MIKEKFPGKLCFGLNSGLGNFDIQGKKIMLAAVKGAGCGERIYDLVFFNWKVYSE